MVVYDEINIQENSSNPKKVEGQSDLRCGFFKNVSSKERMKPGFLWLLVLS